MMHSPRAIGIGAGIRQEPFPHFFYGFHLPAASDHASFIAIDPAGSVSSVHPTAADA
jgi:hypothetical protein